MNDIIAAQVAVVQQVVADVPEKRWRSIFVHFEYYYDDFKTESEY